MRSTSSDLIGSSAVAAGLRHSVGAPEPVIGADAPSPALEILDLARGNGDLCGTVSFEIGSADRADQRPTSAQQREFRDDFGRELERLEQWAAERYWQPRPVAEFHVVVSTRFKISRSLVPAWSGRTGDMEFPAWRVLARKAAILHEQVHALFPNGNRLLAEGLAIHLQAEIGSNPAFPNFGRPLHPVARERLREMIPAFANGDPNRLDQLHLADLDRIATPNPLSLQVGPNFYGEEPRGQGCIYPLAGSFVQFLITTRGADLFRALYEKTPLVPLAQNAGAPERWTAVYGQTLAGLEGEWKSLIARGGENDER